MSGTVTVMPANSLRGELHVPGDKSISHRALLLALASTRPVRIENLATGADVASTLAAVEQLGARVERDEGDPTSLTVTGVGLRGIRPPADGAPIDCGNAGTLVRLVAGLLAGQDGQAFELVGDESLSRRPMRRVAVPLAAMGTEVTLVGGERLPMKITGSSRIAPIAYELPMASAQVQSAVLLAGLFAEGTTTVTEPGALRDHTERMLRRAGANVRRSGRAVRIDGVGEGGIELPDTRVPGDPSSAAPFIVAAMLLRGSLLRLPGLLDNHGRRGLLDVLDRMGSRTGVSGRREVDGEQVHDLEVEHATPGRVFIETDDIGRMIDEVPLLAVIGHFRRGETIVRGAAELRHKESDRIADLALAMKHVGIAFQPLRDGFIIKGSSVRPDGGTMDAAGDHRLAMLGAVVGLLSRHGVTIENADCVDVSYPGFFEVLEQLAVR